MTILLIDDEKDFTELTSTLLRFHDMEVDVVNDPRELNQRLQKTPYRLVVTDLMMPEIDGFRLIETLRSDKAYKKVPMIALSAKVLTDQERKFLLVNEVHFLPKPFEPQNLVEQIERILSDSTD